MAAQFDGSSQYLEYSHNVALTVPFSVGCWFYPFSVDTTTRCVISVMNAGTTGNGWDLEYDTTSGLGWWAAVTGNWNGALVSAPTAGQWHFALCRAITSTNRRIACLYPDGSIAHAQNTVSISPTSTTRFSIGALRESTVSAFMDGLVAEYWIANVDVASGTAGVGAAAPNELVMLLAAKGPFAVQKFTNNIVAYRSLRVGCGSDQDVFGEQYWGSRAPQTWSNVGGAILGPHPPLAPDYMRPADFRQLVPI